MAEKIDARQLAGQYFKEGFNCAESVLRAFRDILELNLSDDALRMASGFGGGLGHAGCICGALSASVMVISALQGRLSKEQSRSPVYTAAEEFHRMFSEKFGGTCCRVLNRHEFGTKDQRLNCLRLTGDTAGLLQEYIEEKQLRNKVD